MFVEEARQILNDAIKKYKTFPFQTLQGLVQHPHEIEWSGASGIVYLVQCQAFRGSSLNSALRVVIAVDAGGYGTFFPVHREFCIARSGRITEPHPALALIRQKLHRFRVRYL